MMRTTVSNSMWRVIILLSFLLCVSSEVCNEDGCRISCQPARYWIQNKTCNCYCTVGDGLLTPSQWQYISQEVTARASSTPVFGKWDAFTQDGNIRIAYDFDETIAQDNQHKAVIDNALGVLSAITCIQFVPVKLTPELSAIEYADGLIFSVNFVGCRSHIGKLGGFQEIWPCGTHGVVVHEMMHALGFFHEHSRPDRDEHVRVIWENIEAGQSSNFVKYNTSFVDSFSSAYDLYSIMHYDSFSFNINNAPTMVKRSDGSTFTDQRIAPSATDQMQLSQLYHQCNGKRGIAINTYDCYHPLDQGFTYRATVSWTKSLRTCQRWDQQTPHSHKYSPGIVTGAGLEENYCRNPDGRDGGPWCFTTDPEKLWEACDILTCFAGAPKVSQADPPPLVGIPGFWLDYTDWTPCYPSCDLTFQYRTRYCHGNIPGSQTCPGKDYEARECPILPVCDSWGPWSNFSSCDRKCGPGIKTRVRVCSANYCDGKPYEDVSCKNKDCPLYDDRGCFNKTNLDSYRGKMSISKSGERCKRWTRSPLKPTNYPDKDLYRRRCRNPTGRGQPFCFVTENYIDYYENPPVEKRRTIEKICNVSLCNESIVTGAGLEENYCRNPDGRDGGPWCFTTDPEKLWEACDILTCFAGAPKVSQADPPPLVGIPGFWLDYTDWTPCYPSCDLTFQYRTRYCHGNIPGSQTCPGKDYEARECPILPVCDSWGPWSNFSSCDRKCGPGIKTRVRVCSANYCDGKPYEDVSCKNKDCPLYDDRGCFNKTNLDSYRGKMSISKSGERCKRWTRSPLKPTNYPDKDLYRRRCRNPTGRGQPFCFVTENYIDYYENPPVEKRRTIEKICNVSLCNENATWSSYSKWSSCDCETGLRWKVRQCLGGVKGQGSCKRKPYRSRSCNCTNIEPEPPQATIPALPGKSFEVGCVKPGKAYLYRGNVNVTASGHPCQRWDTVYPHIHNYRSHVQILIGDLSENYCRAPDNGDDFPWCYVNSFVIKKERCLIPDCPPEEPSPGIGCLPDLSVSSILAYRGGLNTTISGRTCQRWDLNTPHQHVYKSYNYPNSGLGAHNYCRSAGVNPTFCFTTDPDQQVEACDVPLC